MQMHLKCLTLQNENKNKYKFKIYRKRNYLFLSQLACREEKK